MNKFSIKRTILYCLGGIFIVACSETSEENIGELAQKYATSGNTTPRKHGESQEKCTKLRKSSKQRDTCFCKTVSDF